MDDDYTPGPDRENVLRRNPSLIEKPAPLLENGSHGSLNSHDKPPPNAVATNSSSTLILVKATRETVSYSRELLLQKTQKDVGEQSGHSNNDILNPHEIERRIEQLVITVLESRIDDIRNEMSNSMEKQIHQMQQTLESLYKSINTRSESKGVIALLRSKI